MPHEARPYVLAAWVAATLASPLLIKGKSLFVRQREAVRLLDQQGGAGSYPASQLASTRPDGLSLNSNTLWDSNQNTILRDFVPDLKAHRPQPQMPKRWSQALTAVVISAAISAWIAGDQRMARLGEAFNFKAPPVPEAPLDIKAYIVPPKGFPGLKPQYMAAEGGEAQAHEQSILHISVIGKQPEIMLDGKPVPLGKPLKSIEGEKSTYVYEPILLSEGNHIVSVAGIPRWTIDIAPDSAPKIRLLAAGVSPENPGQLQISACSMGDDHGIAGGQIVLEIPGIDPADAAAKDEIPPSARLPVIGVGGKDFCDPEPPQ